MLPEVLQKGIAGNTKVISAAVLVNAVPMGKARPRFTRKGRCYTPKTTQQAEQQVQQAGRQWYRGEPLAGPLGVEIVAVSAVPASWSQKKRAEALAGVIRPAVKPDFDNVAKLYCDALNSIVWQDDKQIVDGRCIKCYGQQSGVLIWCWAL